MENKKIKLIQYYCGKDQKYRQLIKEVSELNSNYCKLHNYEYCFDFIEKQQVDNFTGNNIFTWCVIAYKIKHIYDYLMKDDADYLVFLDADAAVNNPNIKIENLLDQNHSLFLSRSDGKSEQQVHMVDLAQKMNVMFKNNYLIDYHLDQIWDNFNLYINFERLFWGYLFINEGLIIVKNDDLMKRFFKDAVTLAPYFNDIKYNFLTTDCRVLQLLILRNPYKDAWTFLYPQVQGSHASVYDVKYDEDKTFVLHDYQFRSRDDKLNNIKLLKTNKWWKPILEKGELI